MQSKASETMGRCDQRACDIRSPSAFLRSPVEPERPCGLPDPPVAS